MREIKKIKIADIDVGERKREMDSAGFSAAEIEMEEIAENLRELTVLERSEQIARWVELYGERKAFSDKLAKTISMITPKQCRGARAMLRMGVKELAHKASISMTTVNRFERELAEPHRLTLLAIQRVLEDAGVEFTWDQGEGVRMRKRARSE